jgi:ADP-ribosylglycohydrolase
MLLSYALMRRLLYQVIADKEEQGHQTAGLDDELAGLPDGLPDDYERLADFARRLAMLPLRADWPYVEPSDLAGIWGECDPDRPAGAIGTVDLDDAAARVRAGFLGSVCGCVLGKPVEVMATLDELHDALSAIGEWPIRDYLPERLATDGLLRLHWSWPECVRGRIRWVPPDDDINYTLLGMLVLEERGRQFTKDDVRRLWLDHLPGTWTWGPERTVLGRLVTASTGYEQDDTDLETIADLLNPGEELCGALIRADAYGYACPGCPALAAQLAWQDASLTHRRTGVYGAMFIAAAIATAFVVTDPVQVFRVVLGFVPRRSRFHEIVADTIDLVAAADDWQQAYRAIHGRYGHYGHCRVYQEVGTVINTLRFAGDVGDGICMQVMQGNDTDSFGATAGALLGVHLGPGRLEERWLEPFRDTLHTRLAGFYETSLDAVADRISRLPARIAADLP